MTDRENLCIANSAAGRPGERGFRKGRHRKTADGRKNYVSRRLMRKMWLWTFGAMQIGQWAIYAPTGFGHIDTMLCLRIRIDVSTTTTEQGVWGYCNTLVLFCFHCQGTRMDQLCTNFDECCHSSIYSNWFIVGVAIDGWPDRENTGSENIITTYRICSVWAL